MDITFYQFYIIFFFNIISLRQYYFRDIFYKVSYLNKHVLLQIELAISYEHNMKITM